jgi:hypothetical protein
MYIPASIESRRLGSEEGLKVAESLQEEQTAKGMWLRVDELEENILISIKCPKSHLSELWTRSACDDLPADSTAKGTSGSGWAGLANGKAFLGEA